MTSSTERSVLTTSTVVLVSWLKKTLRCEPSVADRP